MTFSKIANKWPANCDCRDEPGHCQTHATLKLKTLFDRIKATGPPPRPPDLESESCGRTERLPALKQPKNGFATRGLLLFCLYFCLAIHSLAQSQPTEYQIKAAFLFNFAKFVEWPAESFPTTNAPIVIGVLGKNDFGADLENTIRDKTVNNRVFKFKNFTTASEATNCHILFISSSEKDNFSRIMPGLNRASVLTVSETDGFIEAGGMINFTIQSNKTRFQINDDAAKGAGLKVSSKLLSLAVQNHKSSAAGD